MKVGNLRIDAVYDGVLTMPPSGVYPGVEPGRWDRHHHLLDTAGNVQMTLGGYLVRSGERTVLVDAGVGAEPKAPFTGGRLLDSLADLGVRPEDVTDVLFTHLHFDHIGWASERDTVVFPRATYRCHAADWQYFVTDAHVQPWEADVSHPHAAPAVRLAPIAGRLEPWTGSGPLLPGIDVLELPGHTPGTTVIVLSSRGERGMLIGDVAHCPVELLEDDWDGTGDVDADAARAARNRLVAQLDGHDVPIAAAHFPDLRWGRVQRLDDGRRTWQVAGVS